MNRIYLSCDIEGVCGICHWNETELGHAEHAAFARQMTREVAAACEGARLGGADDLLIKDAHDSARNLIPEALPEGVSLFRGWGKDADTMLSGLDGSFAGCLFTGYHAAAGTDANPLSHTLDTRAARVRINGAPASEMRINAYTAASYDVPVLLVTGDEGVCREAKELMPSVFTVPVSRGVGAGSIALHPADAARRIRQTAEQAVREGLADPARFALELPSAFTVEVTYKSHPDARRAGFYPGARQQDAQTVVYHATAWLDVLRFFLFCL